MDNETLSGLTLFKVVGRIFAWEANAHDNPIVYIYHGIFVGSSMKTLLENKQYLTDAVMTEILNRLESESENAVSAKDIVPSMSLRDDLGMDSMQAVSLTLDLEDSLGISIDDEDLIKLDTVGDLLDIIESKLSEKNG